MIAQSADDFWIEVNANGEWFHHPVGRSIDTVYVASMHGVYRSVDTCQTWQCVGFENPKTMSCMLPLIVHPLYINGMDIHGTRWDMLPFRHLDHSLRHLTARFMLATLEV